MCVRFNKRVDDFDDLRAFNDYLEEVEDIGAYVTWLLVTLPNAPVAFNLINNIDVPETEARIQAYRKANQASTALNMQREEAYALALKEQEDMDRKEREFRASELLREEQQEREEKEKGRREIIDKLETSQKDAKQVVAKSRAQALKRSAKASTSGAGPGVGQTGDYARLLKTRTAKPTVPDEPHVPMDDEWDAYEDMFVLRPTGYNDPSSLAVRQDRDGIMRGGGYKVEEAWERALRSAFAGLDLPTLQGLPDAPSIDSGGDTVMAAS